MRCWKSIFTLLILCAWASPLHAWMWEVGDEELSEVTGEGFSSFTLEQDVARAFFNVNVSTYTQIDSLKMGYYDDGVTTGWDQDWTNVSLGSATENLEIRGVFMEAKFQNLTDPATRKLQYVKIGTPDMKGPISANFNSFSGRITDSGTVLVDGRRLNLGARTIYSNNGDFSLTMDRDAGWSAEWGNATITP